MLVQILQQMQNEINLITWIETKRFRLRMQPEEGCSNLVMNLANETEAKVIICMRDLHLQLARE